MENGEKVSKQGYLCPQDSKGGTYPQDSAGGGYLTQITPPPPIYASESDVIDRWWKQLRYL